MLSANPVHLPMGKGVVWVIFILRGINLKAPYLCIVAGGLLLMETTKFVVAVTQHVVLMVNLLFLPMEVGSFCSF